MTAAVVRAFAPGRVNIIGDHTDYTGGLVLPMAIDLGTTVEVERVGAMVSLRSEDEERAAEIPLGVEDPASVEPAWARYVAGVVAELGPDVGALGTVATTLPIGAGLSSSASLEVAVALALGFEGTSLELAQTCQRAEHRASGVPSGVMDQLVSAAGVEGAALLIDCTTLQVEPVALPDDVEVVAVFGQTRALVGSPYAERRAQCEQAEARIGPLRSATPESVTGIDDPVIRRRAAHVVSENGRVRDCVDALGVGDLDGVGSLLAASHASLRDDFDVSTPVLDALVERLAATPGVFGARITGGGFGGCAVALTRLGALQGGALDGWHLRPTAGASRC